jgi:O-antigen ligase
MASLGSFRVQPIRTLSGFIPVQIREYRASRTFVLCALLLVGALLLGGGTHGGYWSDAVLELFAIPVFLISLAWLFDLPIWQTRTRRDVYFVLAFCSVIAFLPLIQLIPLPPWIWTNLPGREQMVAVYNLIGDQIPWMPLSVSPSVTWQSLLSLLPPFAIFFLTIQLSYQERRALSLVILGMGVVSVFLGLTQVAQGPSSLLRFFYGNDTEAVGFFANRNHFAAFLYAVLLSAAVWALEFGFKIKSWADLKNFEAGKVTALLATFLVIIIIIAGEAMARSRAGLGLTIVALLAVFALSFRDRRNASGAKASKIILAAIMFGIVLSMQFAVYRILGRFATDPVESARTVFAVTTIKAGKAFMPFGSGIGTFVPVYQLFEQPSGALPNIYVNRAHNDFLEIWLETGVVGPILLGVFAIWLGIAALRVWRRPTANMNPFNPFDCNLARAATVIVALLLAHSVVDYPIRTEAIMAVFAVCCAILIAPVEKGEEGVKFATSLERYLVRRKGSQKTKEVAVGRGLASASAAVPVPQTEPAARPQGQGARTWGAEIEWPEEWRDSREHNGESNPKSDTNDTSKVESES